MNTLEITVQRKDGESWPIVVIDRREGRQHSRVVGKSRIEMADLLQAIEPHNYGVILGEALFKDNVRDAFISALSAVDEHLRVALFVEPDELKPLRWERICAPMDRGWEYLTLSQRTPFSLLTPSQSDRFPPPVPDYDVNALVVAASPSDLSRAGLEKFNVEAAVQGVCAAFSQVAYDVLATEVAGIERSGPPTLDAMATAMTAQRYTFLHVVCHGQYHKKDGETVLYLEGPDGAVDPVSASRLINRLRKLGDALPRMVFLSTCDSAVPEAEGALGGLAQRVVRELGVSAAVAMTEKISVETANALGAAFYPRLLAHGQPDLALAEAATAIADRADVTVPALFCRAPEDNQIIEISQGDARLMIETERWEPKTVLIPAGSFLMGGEPGERIPAYEAHQHEVTLPRYRMGRYPVTSYEYATFLAATERMAPPELGWEGNSPLAEHEEHPVSGVTWYEAVAYCEWLSQPENTGRPYSLPSEAQWEKAAREAGKCCDMIGNVHEWTTTLWGPKRRTPADQFKYPWVADDGRDDQNANGQIRRIVRGGAGANADMPPRVSQRRSQMPDQRGMPGARIGFRIVMRLEQ